MLYVPWSSKSSVANTDRGWDSNAMRVEIFQRQGPPGDNASTLAALCSHAITTDRRLTKSWSRMEDMISGISAAERSGPRAEEPPVCSGSSAAQAYWLTRGWHSTVLTVPKPISIRTWHRLQRVKCEVFHLNNLQHHRLVRRHDACFMNSCWRLSR